MKTVLKSRATSVVLCLAAVFACSVTARAADATFTATEKADYTVPQPMIHLDGKGNATQLGAYTVTFDVAVDKKHFTVAGKFALDAGSGNTLSGTVSGGGKPSDQPDHLDITNPFTITSGTGRFKGATGVLMVHRLLSQKDDTSSGTITGPIKLADGTTLAVGS